MSHAWRLIETGPASGSWNMGVDEALLATAIAGRATLRLYSWDGPWLSLGYAQEGGDDLTRDCRLAGVGLVRRATGGRAVLHGGDLTYAIAAPESALPSGLRAAYLKVSQVLLWALESVGVKAERVPGDGRNRSRGPRRSEAFDCFEVPAPDEICLGRGKLAGSAQRRAGGAVLQHGSIRLRPDPEAAAGAVGLLGAGATSLQQEGHEVAEGDLRQALVEAFGEVFGVALAPDSVSASEHSTALSRVRQHSRDPLSRPQLPR